ncbi:hypothetical protein SBOR_9571 [Sclerotinia borealis F-4128]|uniref:Uncharacterized protein n=1 Tax=Sclerotinia borealis (strain F-4128) TaxID=1432307 RepID=W9BZN7_SCLBF|nr:hypothetical protein SBOR_9571 [Sclerotinia borealis F-4128]
MSGVEFIAVLGIASNIIAVVDACVKIQDRIQSYRQNTAFRDLCLQLPLLVSAIESLRSPQYRDRLDPSTERALIRVLEGCLRQLQSLEGLIKDLTPSNAASKLQKTWKGIRSFGKDTKVREIVGILAEYKSTIALHLSTVHVHSATNPRVSLSDKKSYFDVPHSRLSHFVGRKDVLDQIQMALQASHNNPSIAVLTGVGGQGKTQIALEFCHQHLSRFKGVFWVDASSRVSAFRGYERILKTIDSTTVLAGSEENKSLVRNILRDWNEPWLLIFDNYDDPKSFSDLSSFFPAASNKNSAIIVTSRHISSGRLGSHLRLDGLTEEDSLQLLTSRCSSASGTEDDLREGRDIVKRLGYLPLAIDQAASYISIRQLPLHMFSTHFQKRKEFILNDTPQSLWEYQRRRGLADPQGTSEHLSVLTTWELSFDQISGNDKDREWIGEFLVQAAYFSPTSISETLFNTHDSHNAHSLEWRSVFCSGGSWDTFKFQDIVVSLVNLSLIQSMEITSHEDWLQLRKSAERRRAYVYLAITSTASVIQERDTEMFSLQKRQELLSHIDACIDNTTCYLTDQKSIIEYGGFVEGFQTTFATFYGQHDRNLDAERLFRQSLDTQMSQLGTNNIATLSTMNNLAALYLDSKRLDEARPLLYQALAIKESILGAEHPRTLNTVNNLGNLLVLQLNFDDATNMYQRTLAGYQKLKGPIHKTVIESLNNLGEVAMKRGNFSEAEGLFQEGLRKLQICSGGEEDALALYVKSNVALVYKLQHRYEEAENAYHTLIEKRKALLGSKHSSTLQSICELADVYFALGQLKLAGEWYLQGGASRERVITGTTSYRTPSEEATSLHLKFELLAILNDQGIPDTASDVSPASIDRSGPCIPDDSIHHSQPNMLDSPGILEPHQPQTTNLVKSSSGQLPLEFCELDSVGIQRQQCPSPCHMRLPMLQPTRSHMLSRVDRGGLNIPQQAPPHNAFSPSDMSLFQTQKVEWGKVKTPSDWHLLLKHTPDSSSVPAQNSIDRQGKAFRNKQVAITPLRLAFPSNSTPIRETTQDIDRRERPQNKRRLSLGEETLLNKLADPSTRTQQLQSNPPKIAAIDHSNIGVRQHLGSANEVVNDLKLEWSSSAIVPLSDWATSLDSIDRNGGNFENLPQDNSRLSKEEGKSWRQT